MVQFKCCSMFCANINNVSVAVKDKNDLFKIILHKRSDVTGLIESNNGISLCRVKAA